MEPYFYILIGLILGGVIGWLWGLRSASSMDSNPIVQELRGQIERKETHLKEADSEIEQHRQTAVESEKKLAAAQAEIRAAEDRIKAQEASVEKSLQQMQDAFKVLSADTLKQTQPQLVQLVEKTFAALHESAKGDLNQRQESIKTLVKPLEEQLKIYQERLQQSEKESHRAIGDVSRHLKILAEQSETLSSETLQLRKVLSSNQARGRWGEETLRRVVEAAGLSQHCEFSEQEQSGDSKPDMVVQLPGDRVILVDSKVPDLDFLSSLEESDETRRKDALAAHAKKMKDTIKALADKNYPENFANSLDYVVFFLPAESLFSAALEGDRDLIVWAAQRRILLATPASLIALLRSVSVSWQQHEQTENAQKIANAAQELYKRVAKLSEHFEKMRKGLGNAVDGYNAAMGSYNRVRKAGERLVEFGTDDNNKEILQLEFLNPAIRDPDLE